MSTRREAGALTFWLGAGLAAAVFSILTLGERRRPLRRSVEPRRRRLARNLAIAAVSAAVVQVCDRPLTRRVAALVERRGWGLLPRALSRWQSALLLSILFHHSNVRLPLALERAFALLLVTPRQHGIHHSVVREERDSNWSSLLNVWDRLHGTLHLDVPQEAITIGLPALRDPREVSLARLAVLPFAHDAPDVRALPVPSTS
jgi:hypothetical protein